MVVTGQGVLCPLGNNVEEFWKRLIAGESGIGPVTRFDTAAYDTRFAGEVRDFKPESVMDRKDVRRSDLFVQFAVAATAQAREQAGIKEGTGDPDRFGVIVG